MIVTSLRVELLSSGYRGRALRLEAGCMPGEGITPRGLSLITANLANLFGGASDAHPIVTGTNMRPAPLNCHRGNRSRRGSPLASATPVNSPRANKIHSPDCQERSRPNLTLIRSVSSIKVVMWLRDNPPPPPASLASQCARCRGVPGCTHGLAIGEPVFGSWRQRGSQPVTKLGRERA